MRIYGRLRTLRSKAAQSSACSNQIHSKPLELRQVVRAVNDALARDDRLPRAIAVAARRCLGCMASGGSTSSLPSYISTGATDGGTE